MLICPTCGEENPEGARFCNACGNALQAEEPLGEERKVVTVVFADLVGFTAKSEQLDPEDVRGVLAPYHAHLRAELERFGGTVEKFIGDAVMAVFGAPISHEDDPERAVRAALAIRDWIAEQPDLQARIAVNTGEAIVNVGARAVEGEGMVAGDVVNTAARMQGAAPVNGVLIGEMTYRATRDAIEYREAAPVMAKGKASPVLAWEAVAPLNRSGPDISPRSDMPLVGREREVNLLHSLLERVCEERSAQLVTLVGVPGIGKSRLVGELSRSVAHEPSAIKWRQGRCLAYGESVSFWALGEIVKEEARILESDSPGEAEKKLEEAVAGVVPDPTEARWIEAELRALVGLRTNGAQAPGAETGAAAWRRFLETLAEKQPTVLVIEDLHWADDGLLDFLDDLVDWIGSAPLLVIGTARPEFLERRQGWAGGKANATTISLQPLAGNDMARLLSALLGQSLTLAEEQRTLLERAGGNPLFAEQYVRMLGERGTTGELPVSVQAVIAARLDALPRPEKELLQEAAVHGKVFWLGGVASATRIERAAAEQLLRSLERKGFVERERQSSVAADTQYSFQHILLRDVSYGQIPRRGRAEKHRRAAEWIEELGRPDDHAELLAYHYKEALELERATGVPSDPALLRRVRDALRAAGERARALSAFPSAAEFFAEALELMQAGEKERAELLLARARSLLPIAGSGLEVAVEALESFRVAGNAEGVAESATTAASFAWSAGDRAEADRYTALALVAVAEAPESRARVEALTSQSGFHMLGGRFAESIDVGAEALPLAEALEMPEQMARLHIVVGCARCSSGDRAGLDQIREGISIAEAAGALNMVVLGYGNLSSELQFLARLSEARSASQTSAELAARYGLARHLSQTRFDVAASSYTDGRWGEAMAIADESIAIVEAGERDYNDPLILSLRAWIRLARGDTAGADRDSRRATDLARASDAQAHSAAYTVRAAVALALGDGDEASARAAELLTIGPVMVAALCQSFPTLVDVAWVFTDLSREAEFVEAVLDRDPIRSPWHDAARAIVTGDFSRAADLIDEIGDAAAAAYARLRAARALASEGRREEAAAQYASAESFYRELDASGFLLGGEGRAEVSGSRRASP